MLKRNWGGAEKRGCDKGKFEQSKVYMSTSFTLTTWTREVTMQQQGQEGLESSERASAPHTAGLPAVSPAYLLF